MIGAGALSPGALLARRHAVLRDIIGPPSTLDREVAPSSGARSPQQESRAMPELMWPPTSARCIAPAAGGQAGPDAGARRPRRREELPWRG